MSNLIKVALNLPIYHTFDYMVPKGMNQPLAGIRVEIPFGRKKMVGITVKAGNAALEGASIMLLNGGMREVIEKMAHRIEHIELETTSDFFDIFVEGCMFKPMATVFP